MSDDGALNLTTAEIADIGHGLSEWLDDAAPLNERRYVFAAEGSVTRRVNAIINNREARVREQVAQDIEALMHAACEPNVNECDACWDITMAARIARGGGTA